jgi:antitoxin MazE
MYIHMPNDTHVAKWGNSLAVRIPQAIVTEARLAEGDRLSLDLGGDGSIVLRSRRRKYSLDQLVAAIRPGNRHHETDWGPPKGKETW